MRETRDIEAMLTFDKTPVYIRIRCSKIEKLYLGLKESDCSGRIAQRKMRSVNVRKWVS